MKTKKWLLWVLGFFTLLSIVHLLAVYNFYKYPQTWIANAYHKKEQILANSNSPKIMIIGGSNVIFGVSASQIEKTLKTPAINYGINAGLEVDYILHLSKKHLKKGDIAILPLEYEHFSKTKDLNRLRIAYILNYDRDYFSSLSILEKLQYLSSISFDEFILSFFATKNELNYNSQTINKNGDETANFDEHKINSFISRKSHDKALNNPIFTPSFGTKKILEFAKWCEQNGVKMYLTWPSTIYFEEYSNPNYQKYFYNLERYFASNNVDTLGTPNDFLYPLEYFYDTNYHLNANGMKIRTQKLVDLLYNHPKFKNLSEQK